MTPIYKKKGRRYIEIGVCDPEEMYYPHGAHMVIARPGATLTHYNIEPDYVAVEAAMVAAQDAMLEAMREASQLQPDRKLVGKERKAYAAYCEVLGGVPSLTLRGASLSDVVQAGLDAVREKIKKGEVCPGRIGE